MTYQLIFKSLFSISVMVIVLCGSAAHARIDSPSEPQYLPMKHKVRHGKPLFKYPKENPVYIVTYTQDDLLAMRSRSRLRSRISVSQ